MKKATLALALAAILCGTMLPSCGGGSGSTANEDPKKDSIPILGFWEEDYIKDSTAVQKNEYFSSMMMRLGMSNSATYKLSTLCDTLFNVRRMRPGKEVDAYYSPDSLHRLEYAVYKHSITHYTIFQCGDSLAIWNLYKPTQTVRRYADIVINTSLWDDMTAAGAPWELIGDIADIFAWTVDFFGLQKGDIFRCIYDVQTCEGTTLGVKQVDYCVYCRGSHQDIAVRLDQNDGGGDKYWTPEGQNVRKAFLKAPLKFTRVSSKFSYARKHPVTGKVRPHTGVDYAAPTGTPVHSIGDGVVISSGWKDDGGGNQIRIKHNGVYQTAYLHLSKIEKGIKPGAHVVQGQTIGYVGSTGRSTGPHLDFRVWKNGTPIDPLKMESPSGKPINPEYLDSLKQLSAQYKSEMEAHCNN